MYILYNEDAYKFDKDILVDAIITDPPYNISQKNNFHTLGRKGLDFGEWDKDFDLFGWIDKYIPYLKADGCAIIFCDYKQISYICEALERNNMIVKDLLVWSKTNPMPRNTNRVYVRDKEYAIWSVKKNSKWTFNRSNEVPYHRSTFYTPTVLGNERTIHPTQKSLQLMYNLVEIHTNEGDIVLDPFMGSGTTGAACMKLYRDFIGIEIDKQYYDIAEERIKKESNRLKILFPGAFK